MVILISKNGCEILPHVALAPVALRQLASLNSFPAVWFCQAVCGVCVQLGGAQGDKVSLPSLLVSRDARPHMMFYVAKLDINR